MIDNTKPRRPHRRSKSLSTKDLNRAEHDIFKFLLSVLRNDDAKFSEQLAAAKQLLQLTQRYREFDPVPNKRGDRFFDEDVFNQTPAASPVAGQDTLQDI